MCNVLHGRDGEGCGKAFEFLRWVAIVWMPSVMIGTLIRCVTQVFALQRDPGVAEKQLKGIIRDSVYNTFYNDWRVAVASGGEVSGYLVHIFAPCAMSVTVFGHVTANGCFITSSDLVQTRAKFLLSLCMLVIDRLMDDKVNALRQIEGLIRVRFPLLLTFCCHAFPTLVCAFCTCLHPLYSIVRSPSYVDDVRWCKMLYRTRNLCLNEVATFL